MTMTLREYIKNLQEFAKANPDALNYSVVYASDPEGNAFRQVRCTPSVGNFDGELDFIQNDGTEEFRNEYEENAVCIN